MTLPVSIVKQYKPEEQPELSWLYRISNRPEPAVIFSGMLKSPELASQSPWINFAESGSRSRQQSRVFVGLFMAYVLIFELKNNAINR